MSLIWSTANLVAHTPAWTWPWDGVLACSHCARAWFVVKGNCMVWCGGVPYKSKISVSVTVLCVCACACVYVCVYCMCVCVCDFLELHVNINTRWVILLSWQHVQWISPGWGGRWGEPAVACTGQWKQTSSWPQRSRRTQNGGVSPVSCSHCGMFPLGLSPFSSYLWWRRTPLLPSGGHEHPWLSASLSGAWESGCGGGEGEARGLVGHHCQHGVHVHQVGVVNQRGRPHPLPLIFTRHTHIAHITTSI